jgi:hypothetical protein
MKKNQVAAICLAAGLGLSASIIAVAQDNAPTTAPRPGGLTIPDFKPALGTI